MLSKGQGHYVMSCLFVFVCEFLFWCCFILLCFGFVDFGCDVNDDGFVFLGFLVYFSSCSIIWFFYFSCVL
jgi:hypothetical protein